MTSGRFHAVAIKWLACAVAVLTVGLGSATASAQLAPLPMRSSIDDNGVDVLRNAFNSSMTDVSIGTGRSGGLAFTRYWTGGGWRNSVAGTLSGNVTNPVVSVGGATETFTQTGSTYVADSGSGATLVKDAPTVGQYTYTSSSGTVVVFKKYTNTAIYASDLGVADTITFPEGTKWSYTYRTDSYSLCLPPGGCTPINVTRMQSLSTNRGYHLKFNYSADSMTTIATLQPWWTLTKVTAINSAVEYCDPTAISCTLSGSWPNATYSAGVTTATDALGRVWTYSYTSGKLTGIRRPGASSDDVTIGYTGTDVTSVARAGQTWTYGATTGSGTRTTTVTDPLSHTRVVVANTSIFRVTSDTDESSRTTLYEYYTPSGLLKKETAPEGDSVSYVYDARGNATGRGAGGRPHDPGHAVLGHRDEP